MERVDRVRGWRSKSFTAHVMKGKGKEDKHTHTPASFLGPVVSFPVFPTLPKTGYGIRLQHKQRQWADYCSSSRQETWGPFPPATALCSLTKGEEPQSRHAIKLTLPKNQLEFITGERNGNRAAPPSASCGRWVQGIAGRGADPRASGPHRTCVSRRRSSLTTRSMFMIGLKYKAQ